MEKDILEELVDLQKQATVERSHYYVAKCAERAIEEITRLRADRIDPNYTLPCDVILGPATRFAKGVKLSTLLVGLIAREQLGR